MRRGLIAVSSILALALCGCGTKGAEESATVQVQPTVGFEESDRVVRDFASPIFSVNDTLPLLENGSVAGYVSINRVTRLGIWDWYNTEAVTNGVKYSYSVNFTLDLTESIGNYSDGVKLLSEAYLVDGNGNEIGKPCNVGWSGFETVAQLYQNSPSMTVEIGVQPNAEVSESVQLKLCVRTADGKEFTPILLGNDAISTAVEGPSVRTEAATVTSINGATYSIEIADVYDSYNPTTDSISKNKLERFYDFQYRVWYKTAPTVDREVLSFDSFNGNALQSKMVIGVQSDADSTVLYENDSRALWFMYSDSSKTTTYVSEGDLAIQPGYEAQYGANRKVPETTTTQPVYLRFRIEFPEEQKARSLQERLDFDGRFLVYQLPIGERSMMTVHESLQEENEDESDE